MNTDFLHGVEVVEIDDEIRPIRTLKSSVIGLVGTAGKGAKNIATLTTSLRDAVNKFGEWVYGDGFTIPYSLKMIYAQFKATVVTINVCDVEAEKADINDELVTLNKYNGKGKLLKGFVSDVAPSTTIKAKVTFPDKEDATITLPAGITITHVKSANGVTTYTTTTHYTYSGGVLTNTDHVSGIPQGATVELTYTVTDLVAGTDYTVDNDAGTITRAITGSKILPGAVLTVDYSHVTAADVTAADIMGGVAEDTDDYKGMWALLGAKTTLGLKPRILLAPGFTHQKPDANTRNAVVSEFLIIAKRMGAIILADGPNTTDEAAVQYAADWGEDRVYVLDPFVKVRAPVDEEIYALLPYSTVMAGLIAWTDANFGFWASPSNKLISGIVGTARPIEFGLNDPNCRANYLNEHKVTTIVHEEGYRSWGNRTTSFDPKFSFLNIRRGADIIQESILFAHLWAVDRNITKQFVENVVDGVQAYLDYLKTFGAVLGGRAWADPDINTPAVIQTGQLFIDFDFTVPYVAERITFRAHLVNDYVVEIFN